MKRLLSLLLFSFISFYGIAQPVENSDEAKGEYEVIVDYDPSAVGTPSKIPAAIILNTFEANFVEKGGYVQLRWKIDQILGAFVVEHSTDGAVFNEIGVLNGASGFEDNYYIYEAREFDPKVNFYRLKQVIGGKIIYSKVLNVSVSPNDDEHFLQLEDLGDRRRIKLRVREEQKVTIKLLDANGKTVKVLLNQDLGINEIVFRTIDKGNFKPGKYFILIEGNKFKQSKKIILP